MSPGPDAILATNTSALSVSEIAEATEQPQRVVGMHFFNPGARSAAGRDRPWRARARRGGRCGLRVRPSSAGKQPVRCNDTPGFIVNRILIPLLNDCVRVLDEAGVAPEADGQGDDERCRLAAGPVRARST